MFNKVKVYAAICAVACLSVVAPEAAFATGPDYTTITAAVDWSAVSTAILAVFALVAGVMVVFKGGKMLLKAIR